MDHIALLGDSIFDNAAYVPGGDPVIDQLRARLPAGSRATLLATDGAVVESVSRQLDQLPADATHLAVSIGGNDALENSYVLRLEGLSNHEAFRELAEIQQRFAANYRHLLTRLAAARKPVLLCTIYDAIPGLEREAVTALSIFNDVILRAAIAAGLPVLDLRFVCTDPRDYSAVSPIEPSETGGAKITRALWQAIHEHDFSEPRCVIYR